MVLDQHPDMRDPSWVGKRFIGYWRVPSGHGESGFENFRSSLPNPRDYVDLTWDKAERDTVLERLRVATVFVQWRGYASCRMCDGHYGTSCRTLDGTWVFPQGFSHYIEVHGVRPPRVFIDHVLNLPAPLVSELTEHIARTEGYRAQHRAMEDGDGCEVKKRGECLPPPDDAFRSIIQCRRGNTSSGSCLSASDFLCEAADKERARHQAALAALGVQIKPM